MFDEQLDSCTSLRLWPFQIHKLENQYFDMANPQGNALRGEGGLLWGLKCMLSSEPSSNAGQTEQTELKFYAMLTNHVCRHLHVVAGYEGLLSITAVNGKKSQFRAEDRIFSGSSSTSTAQSHRDR